MPCAVVFDLLALLDSWWVRDVAAGNEADGRRWRGHEGGVAGLEGYG